MSGEEGIEQAGGVIGEFVNAEKRQIRIVKQGEKKMPEAHTRAENCANIPPEVRRRIFDLRRRLNMLQDELDDLCALVKA